MCETARSKVNARLFVKLCVPVTRGVRICRGSPCQCREEREFMWLTASIRTSGERVASREIFSNRRKSAYSMLRAMASAVTSANHEVLDFEGDFQNMRRCGIFGDEGDGEQVASMMIPFP